MRKIRFSLMAFFVMLIGVVALLGMKQTPVQAAVEIGVISESDVPAWVKGHEEGVKNTFVEAYNEANFTVEPDAPVVPVDLGKARVILFQDFGSEGTIFLNDVKGKALVVKNALAITELKVLLGLEGDPLITDQHLKALLLDVVESSGETYYITDRRNDDGIFKIGKNASDEDEVQYYDKRIGIGAHDYADVTWIEYVKGYQQGHIYMGSLGLPTAAVTRHRYTTSDVNINGTYAKTGDTINTSEKEHTAQQFEHGWLIQARVRVLNPDNTLGGNQNVQYGAAPIWNDMYALVTALDGNSDLSKTGAPVSVEFLVDGVRYQNFEYGYVKVEAGVATFVPEAVVDSHATEMTRRVGISESWNSWNSAANQAYGLNFERLRVGQNFRELVGQMIRDGRTPFKPSESDPYGDTRLYHRGNAAPVKGVWFSGKDGEGPFLGAANVFLYQAHWYHDAFELAPRLNTGDFVDAKDNIGRPIATFTNHYNIVYQLFEDGIGFYDMKPGNQTPVRILGEAELTTFLDGAESFEAALLAKGLAETHHDVVFKDHDGTVLKTESVAHGEAATAPADPTRDHFTFDGWDKAFNQINYDIEIIAQYKAIDYTVTYVLDGGTNHEDNPEKANILSNIELKAATKTGLIFFGWYKEATFETQVTHLTTIKEEVTLYARFVEEITAEDIVGVFAPGSTPDWIVGHNASVKQRFLDAYNAAAFTVVPDEFVQSENFGRTRVMLYQVVGSEGVMVLNEREGEVIVVKDPKFLAALPSLLGNEETKGVLLGVVESEGTTYYVTDKAIFSFNELGAIQLYEHVIGVGTGLVRFEGPGESFTDEVVLNDFNIAYKFAENYMSSLGLPMGAVEMKTYTTFDQDNGTGLLLDGSPTSAKQYYAQQFSNGYILMNRHTHFIQYGAAPIMKDFYDAVVAIDNNADLSITGTPVSVEMTIDGVRYQNFEFGYVKLVDGVAEFTPFWVVDYKGHHINPRIGMSPRFINWHWQTANTTKYLVGWERLRITQNFRNLVGDAIRDDRAPYHITAENPYGNNNIHQLTQRGSADTGLWLIMNGGTGLSLGFGNVFVTQGYWYNLPYEIAPLFNIPLFVDAKNNIGRPVDTWKTLYNAYYQVYDNGIGYMDGIMENPVSITGEAYTAWLGAYGSVEAALEGHGIAEAYHTVKWLDHDGTVLKEELVAHGSAATPPADPTREDYVFAGWEPESYDNIVLPNREFVATYGAEVGTPQSGTHKFINYDTNGVTATFWYEDTTKSIDVNEALYNAYRAKKLTMAESIGVSGIPIYADDANLVTTLKWFYIDTDETVKTKEYTIGTLPADVDTLVEIPTAAAIGAQERRIIQDSFGDAHVFAYDRGGFVLGLPLGPVRVEREIPNPSNPAQYYDILVQEFEFGLIIQEGYNRAAYPIYGDILEHWEKSLEDGGLGGINGDVGIPYTRQFEHDGKIFQTFKYGYVIYDNENFTEEYDESRQLNPNMVEVDKRFGRWVSRSTARNAHPDFEHEFLRTLEAYLEVHARWVEERGYVWGMIVEGNVISWNAYGASQGFSMSSSTSNQWGQTRFTPIPYLSPFASPHPVRNGILDVYAGLGGNEPAGPGFGLEDDWTIKLWVDHDGNVVSADFAGEKIEVEVMYQNFERGYIRAYTIGDTNVGEYFKDATITEDGKHMEEGVEKDHPLFNMSGLEETPVVTKDALQQKLNELKALRAATEELTGDLADLPSNKHYASKAILDQIDTRIASIEAIIADENATQEQVEEALGSVSVSTTLLTNQRQAGQKDVVDPGDPTDPTTPKKANLTWLWITLGVLALAGIGVGVFFFIKKR